MSNIFISYSSKDRARVEVLAGALEHQGWSVWWDRRIPPGKQFSQVIKEAMDEAKCVIVLWSKESVKSEWVQNEASEGARRKILVPALIDDVEIPFEFRRIQAARLVDWEGRSPHPEFDTFLEAVCAVLGQPLLPQRDSEVPSRDVLDHSKPTGLETKKAWSKSQKIKVLAAICIVTLIAIVSIGVFLKYRQPEVSTAPALLRNLTMQFGTKGVDRLHQVAVDREGNMYLAGDVPDMTPLQGIEPGRVFLAKFDRDGRRQWIAQHGHSDEMPGGLATDREGNVHLATYDSRPDPKQPVSLCKYDTRGGKMVRRLRTDDERPVLDLATDESGEICYYAQERVRSDTFPSESRKAEKLGGAEARERFAQLPYGQTMDIRNGGVIWHLKNTRRPDVQKLWIPANAGFDASGKPEGYTQETQPRYIYTACHDFKDEESIVSKSHITWAKVCHGGYIHGLQLGYGCRAGFFHGLETHEYGLQVTEWAVPDGERIVRAEGEIAKNNSGLLYVSRLQFVTDKGTGSPRFGGKQTTPTDTFMAKDPNGLPLRTISGSADLTEHPSRNRAIAGMTFHFGPCVAWDAYLPSDVSVQAIAVDASGGIYACGYRRFSPTIFDLLDTKASEGSQPSSFLARYDPNGKLDWMHWHGDHEHDLSMAVAVDGRGNAYVVDLTVGGTPEKANVGRSDVRIVKYDPAGELLWMRQFGTVLYDVAFSVAVWPPVLPGVAPRDAEAIYVAGITQGNLYDETADLDLTSKLNAFLVAYDPDGRRTFLEQFDLGADVPQDIVYLRMPTWDPIKRQFIERAEREGPWEIPADRPTKSEESIPWDVMRTSWWRRFPVSAVVTTDERGNVYLAGSSETSLDTDYTNKGSTDIFLMRFAPNPEVRK